MDGFHGYEFGTPAGRIGEIDPSGPPDYRHDGLLVYGRTLRFLGMPTRAYFYLDSARRLRRGKHLIEADRSACVRQLNTLRLMLEGTYPDARVRAVRGAGPAADTSLFAGRGAPAFRCPDFVDADTSRTWSVAFRNPASGAVEARVELFRRDGQPRILACYLNESDCAWPDSVGVEQGPNLLAPARGPVPADTAREERP